MIRAIDDLGCIASYFDAILDPEDVQLNPIPDWVSANQEFTTSLPSQSSSSTHKRKIIMSRLRNELLWKIAPMAIESGIEPPELAMWLESRFDRDIQTMGSLGLYSEVYRDKHLDPSTKWNSNDLIDMMFLTCAAGYANFVVGERSLVNYVKQAANRLRRTISVHSRVSDLLVALISAGF